MSFIGDMFRKKPDRVGSTLSPPLSPSEAVKESSSIIKEIINTLNEEMDVENEIDNSLINQLHKAMHERHKNSLNLLRHAQEALLKQEDSHRIAIREEQDRTAKVEDDRNAKEQTIKDLEEELTNFKTQLEEKEQELEEEKELKEEVFDRAVKYVDEIAAYKHTIKNLEDEKMKLKKTIEDMTTDMNNLRAKVNQANVRAQHLAGLRKDHLQIDQKNNSMVFEENFKLVEEWGKLMMQVDYAQKLDLQNLRSDMSRLNETRLTLEGKLKKEEEDKHQLSQKLSDITAAYKNEHNEKDLLFQELITLKLKLDTLRIHMMGSTDFLATLTTKIGRFVSEEQEIAGVDDHIHLESDGEFSDFGTPSARIGSAASTPTVSSYNLRNKRKVCEEIGCIASGSSNKTPKKK